MKVTKEQRKQMFAIIDNAVEVIGVDKIRAYRAERLGKDIEKRFRWDLFWIAKVHKKMDVKGLVDSNIDTVLRQYIAARPNLAL